MDNLIFIGTLHQGYTPKTELEKMLVLHKPQKLFVEIVDADIMSNNLKNYPPEMIVAYKWAKRHDIAVSGFDVDIDTLSAGITKSDLDKVDKEQSAIIDQYDWKDFNKLEFNELLNTKSWDSAIDRAKWDKREQIMYENIVDNLAEDATSVVVTGSGHIKYFREKFPKALFPLA